MKSRTAHLLAATPPLVFAMLVAKLWITGTLQYFVNDRTVWIVLLGAFLSAVIATVQFRSAWYAKGPAPSSWRTAVFLAPVIVGLLVPAAPLSATSGQASSLGSSQVASHVSTGDSFGWWVNALTEHPGANWWRGRQITLVGFVARQVGLSRRTVIVGRYLVTCCVVDATLLGFPVRIGSGPLPRSGAWVQVSGAFGSEWWADPSGSNYPLIENARLSPVSIPSSPYLSP